MFLLRYILSYVLSEDSKDVFNQRFTFELLDLHLTIDDTCLIQERIFASTVKLQLSRLNKKRPKGSALYDISVLTDDEFILLIDFILNSLYSSLLSRLPRQA